MRIRSKEHKKVIKAQNIKTIKRVKGRKVILKWMYGEKILS
jgi:hypothetical protein